MVRVIRHGKHSTQNRVTEAIDTVVCGGVERISHLVVGQEGPVGEVCGIIRAQYPNSYLVALNGQRGGHLEAVIHRPLENA
jgi:hypothetical protein